ncbi:MAG TPA: contractile injection system protein, VgrG/Pvc8 family [Pseudomonadota bacterium]|nr:contractile injection system protein, VgrG/Pvc8 family [Pseudomonadota bacterium]
MLAREQAVHLKLWTGPKDGSLDPAPYRLLRLFAGCEVTQDANQGAGSQGFQLSFSLQRDDEADYSLLSSELLSPLRRIVIGLEIGDSQITLMDGVISHYQLSPDAQSLGQATLALSGRDLGVLMDLEQRDRPFPNQSDADIVRQVLSDYAKLGLQPEVKSTGHGRSRHDRTLHQYETDLRYVQRLAQNNGFVFTLQPQAAGQVRAYFGPRETSDGVLPALTVGLGPGSNVRSLNFSFDPLVAVNTIGHTPDHENRRSRKTVHDEPPPEPLSAHPAPALRTVRLRQVGRRSPADADRAAQAQRQNQPDAVVGSGEVDGAHYGAFIVAGRQIIVRGAGDTYDGLYWVRRVTHRVAPGSYTQQISIGREGTGARPGLRAGG